MKKKIWKYLTGLMLIALSVPGLGVVLNLSTPDTGALYVVMVAVFCMSLLLIYEYMKVRNYNKAIRDVLSDVLQDSDPKYSYTGADDVTAFWLDSTDIIRRIEEDRVRLGPEGLRKLAQKYKDSPKISHYFKLILRVRPE